jgi:hypothetical protein
MTPEKAAALHLVASGFHRGLFIDSGSQISLVGFFRNFDGYVHAVVFNHCENKRPMG